MLYKQPQYARIAQDLSEDISSGKYAVGSFLPTEMELLKHYNVSRHTVRQAVKQLKSSGLVVTRAGLGTKVIDSSPSESRFVFSKDEISDFRRQAEKTHLVNVKISNTTANEAIADSMKCRAGTLLIRIEGLRIIPDNNKKTIVALLDAVLLAKYEGISKDFGPWNTVISQLVERRYRIRVSEILQSIEPIILDKNLAGKLALNEGLPGLKLTRTYLDEKGETFLQGTYYQGGKFARMTGREIPILK
ncbi:MAG: GntR family transcriptional regulator [Gammaproteobacteria bacterium]|nr:GntR family transcriptional regulator [Gammaproteobacteria bacterium]